MWKIVKLGWQNHRIKLRYFILFLFLLIGSSSMVLLLAEDNFPALPAGTLIKTANAPDIYYLGQDQRRYLFPNEATYFSWYHNFSNLQIISQAQMDALVLGPHLTVRPGIRFVKFSDSNRVYAVEPPGTLRWIPSEQIFNRLGYNWQQLVILPVNLRADYLTGEDLTGPANGSLIRQGISGSLFYVQNNLLRPTTMAAMEINRYFPHHVRITDPELTISLPRGNLLTAYDPTVAGRPDQRWNPIDQNEVPENPPEEPDDPIAILPPSALNASATSQDNRVYVQLNWQASATPVANLSGYYVYRSLSPITNLSDSGVTHLASLSATAVNFLDSDQNLNFSTTYYYAVRVRGLSGQFSNIISVSITTGDADAPSAPLPPTNFQSLGREGGIELHWTLSASPNITNYLLYRSLAPINNVESPGVQLITTLSSTAVNYIDGSLPPNTAYYYALRARDNENLLSSIVTVSGTSLALVPNPPTNFQAVADGQQINLSWTLSNSENIQGYLLYRSLSPITNPVEGSGLEPLVTLGPSITSYADENLDLDTTYFYALAAQNINDSLGDAALASATTDDLALLDRVLQIPEYPDHVIPDGLQWSMDTMAMAASMGINKFMVPTRYYQGLNDLDPSYPWDPCLNHDGRFCEPYHTFLNYADTLTTPDGRPVEIILLAAKVTKTAMNAAYNPQLRGAIRLQQMGQTPYNFLSRLSAISGTLSPIGQGDYRAFITINFSNAAERDRLLRLTTNITGSDNVLVRWYPVQWETAKFRNETNPNNVIGVHTFDFPNPTVANNNWMLLIMNYGSTPVNWEILNLEEVAPSASEIRNQDDNYYEWLGNSNAFTTFGYNHPRYALDETHARYINVLRTVWNEFSNHPSLVGLMGNGDEPHAMYWMDEDTARYENAGHELAEFEKNLAAGQYAVSQQPFMLFGDPRDPTHNGISSGVYASNMAGGGFSAMRNYFNGTEPIDWVLWSDLHTTNGISSFTSQGSSVYLMDSLYNQNLAQGFANWVTAASSLTTAEKEHIKGWYYYVESRSYVTQSILQQAINATPDQIP